MKDTNFSFNQKTFLSHGWLNIPREIIEYFNASNDAPYGILEAMVTIILHVNYSEKSYRIKGKTVNCNRAESVRSYADWAKIFHWSRARTKRYFLWLESIGYIQFIDDPNCCSHFAVSFYDEFMYGPKYVSAQKQMRGANKKNNEADVGLESTDRNETMEYKDEANECDTKNECDEASGRDEASEYRNMATKGGDGATGGDSATSSGDSATSGGDVATEDDKGSKCGNAVEYNRNSSMQPERVQKEPHRRTRKEIAAFQHQEFLNFWDAYHNITGIPRKNVGKAEMEWDKLNYQERKLAKENIEKYYYSQESIYYIQQPASYLANKAFLDDFIIDL